MENGAKSEPLPKAPPSAEKNFPQEHIAILEAIIAGNPLHQILSRISLIIESQYPAATWCSISTRTPEHPNKNLIVAPSLPADFIAALQDLPSVDPTTSPPEKPFITQNLLASTTPHPLRKLALQSGITAFTTIPVFGSSANTIATIHLFYQHTPTPKQLEIPHAQEINHLIFLAIEKNLTAHQAHDSTLRFQSVASTSTDAIWDWDITNDTLWWNDGFAKLFGFDGQGKGPSVPEWRERVHPDDRPRVHSSLAHPLKREKKHWSQQYRFFRNDGSIAHVLDKAEIIRDPSGNAIRMIGGMRDLTAYNETKAQLTTLNRALEMLRSCNRILIRATDEKQLLTDICRVAAEVGGYKMAWVGYAEKGKAKRIIPAAHYGEESGYLTEIHLSYSEDDPTGNGPAGRTLRSGQPVVCQDIRTEGDFFWKASAIERELLHVVCLPLKNTEECFGFLSLMSDKVGTLSPDKLALLKELADNLAFGISSIRNRIREETLHNAILKVARSLADTVGNRFYETLTLHLTETLGASVGLIGKVHRSEETVTSLSYVLDGKIMKNFSYSLPGTPCEEVHSGEVCIFENRIQERFPHDHALAALGAESYAGIALLDMENRRSGIIFVIFREPIEDPSLVTSILRIFAERASSEIEREHAENLLVKQASLLDKARDAILTFGLDHRLTYLNSSAEELYGYTFFEAPGNSIRTLLHEEKSAYDNAYNRTIEHGEWLGELRQIDKNGNPVIVESRWNLLPASEGEPPSILSINTDVTRHKNLEQTFLRAQRMESIGTLAGGLAHDLNNVLTPISMSIELLQSSIDNDRAKELLDTISQSTHRGADIVRQILSYARGLENRHDSISTGELFSSIHRIIRDTFPKSIRVEFHLAPQLSPIIGDFTQLHQVLLNLCLNARDAMPEGGTLTLSASNERIDQPLEAASLGIQPGSFIRIDVEDTGHGIPADIQRKIYEPFFTTKAVGKGSGLGLSTSLTIIKNHTGSIHSYSEPTRGAGFRIRLPALPSDTPTPPPAHLPKHPTPPHTRKHTILIVDDEVEIVTMLAIVLEKYGHTTLTATSGTQAAQIYAEKNQEIDTVITDMMMPDFDGAALIHEILTTHPHPAIIPTSGIPAQEQTATAAGCPPGNFLLKPFSAEAILTTLANAHARKDTPTQ